MKKSESPSASLKREQQKAKREHLELTLLQQIRQAGLPTPARGVQLIPGRKWSWDVVWPECMVCAEVNGQTWGLGGHSSGAGLNRDYSKSNSANLAGYTVLAFSGDMVKSGEALETIKEALRLNVPF